MARKSKKSGIKKLQINFTNRWLYTLIVFFSLIVIGVGVYAVAGTTPNPGHPITQLQPCSAGQILKTVGTTWACGTDDGGTGLWSSFSSGIYYEGGEVNIYDNTNPALMFGDAFGNSLKAGVKLQLTDEFLDIGDYMAETTEIGVRFWTNDAERMRIDKSGNVGINTTNPLTPLDVRGLISTSSHIELTEQTSGNRYSYIDFHGDDSYTDYALRIIRYNNGPNAASVITHRGTEDLILETSESGSDIFLSPAGNVGIKTNNPEYDLDVNGSVEADTFILEPDAANDEECDGALEGGMRYRKYESEKRCYQILEICMEDQIEDTFEWYIIVEDSFTCEW